MFTGIIQECGTIVSLRRSPNPDRVEIRASSRLCARLAKGSSIACDGVCLTVARKGKNTFGCDLLPETIARTTFGRLKKGGLVNLELPLRAGDELGGHIVQGHVDGVGVVRSKRQHGAATLVTFSIPKPCAAFVVAQGSIALDGVSLTVVKIIGTTVTVSLTPTTLAQTNFHDSRVGDYVNIEADILAKYAKK